MRLVTAGGLDENRSNPESVRLTLAGEEQNKSGRGVAPPRRHSRGSGADPEEVTF